VADTGDLAAFRARLEARRRRGEPFDAAWDAELKALPEAEPMSQANPEYPTDAALESCTSAWRRAYEREPMTALDRAGARLGEALALLEDDAPLLQPVRTPPPPRVSPTTPTQAGAAAAAAFRRRGWWKSGSRGAA
jgi:hypothetical protein